MENNNLGPKKVRDVDSVNLIDPNPSDNGIYSPEDYSIFVEFSANPRSRSAIVEDGDEINVDSSVSLGRINFVGTGTEFGENIKEKHQSSYYTEIGTNFGEDKDLETLGITNINIDFNSSYTPLIKIDFVDIRGRLFEQQAKQYFSDRVVKKPTNDVFFRQPYPLFYLKIKGFYGKPVTYCLHLTKFNSNFNSETGNLEITTEYIGYTYAFLSDMLMGLVRGASELPDVRDCIKERTFSNDEGNPMLTISELQKSVLDLNSELKRIKASSNDLKVLESQDKTKDAILRLKNSMPDILSGTFESVSSFKNILRDRNMGLFIYVGEKIKNVGFRFGNVDLDNFSFIINERYSKLKNSEFDEITKEYGEITNIESTRDDFNLEEGKTIITTVTSQTFNKDINDTQTHIPSKLTENDGELFYKVKNALKNNEYENKQNVDVIIIDFSLPFSSLNDLLSDFTEQIKSIQQNVSTEIARISKETIGFKPTIKNFLEVITTNIECFINKVKNVSDEAYLGRVEGTELYSTLQGLVSEKEVDKIPKGDNTNVVNIYPFPEYRIKDSNGRQTESWIGNRLPNIPEVEFVEELLEAIIRGVKADDDFSRGLGGENQASKIKTWVPINPLDSLPLLKEYNPNEEDSNLNPWKRLNDIDLSGINENVSNDINNKLFFLTLLRGFIFINHTCKSVSKNEVKIMAELEANNCFNNLENVNYVKRLIKNTYSSSEDLYQNIIDFITKSLNILTLDENEGGFSNAAITDIKSDISPRYVLSSDIFNIQNRIGFKSVINLYPSYSTVNRSGLAYGSDMGSENSALYTKGEPLINNLEDSVNNKLIQILNVSDYENIVNKYQPFDYVNDIYNKYNYNVNIVDYNIQELLINFGLLNPENLKQRLNPFRKDYIDDNDFSLVDSSNSIKNTFFVTENPLGTTVYSTPRDLDNSEITEIPSTKPIFYYNEYESNKTGVDGVGEITKSDGNKNIFYHGFYTVCQKRKQNVNNNTNYDLNNDSVLYLDNSYDGVLNFFEENRPLDTGTLHGSTSLLLQQNSDDVSVPFITFSKTFIGTNSPLLKSYVDDDSDLKKAYKSLKTNDIRYYSLFGDLLYYNLESEEDRALHFLHSLPIKGLEGTLIKKEKIGEDENTITNLSQAINNYFFYDENKSIDKFSDREGMFFKYIYNGIGSVLSDRASTVRVSYSWLLLIGGLIYRYDKNYNISKSINDWDYLSDYYVPFISKGDDVRGYHTFNGKINLNVFTDLKTVGGFVKNGSNNVGVTFKKDLDMVLRYLPVNVKNELKNIFISWVNDTNGWVKLRNKLEIFESETINNSRQFNIPEIITTLNNINNTGNADNIDVNEIRKYSNTKVSGNIKIKNLENYSVFTLLKESLFIPSLVRSVWLEIKDDSELNKDLVSFLKEERILVSSSWRPWSIDNYISKNNVNVNPSNVSIGPLYLGNMASQERTVLKKKIEGNSDILWLINNNENNYLWEIDEYSRTNIYPLVSTVGNNFKELDSLIPKSLLESYKQRISKRISKRLSLYYTPKSVLESYIEQFSKTLYSLCGGFSEIEEEDEKENLKYQIFGSTDNDTIKLTIYKSIKNIYNKWISGLGNPNNPCFSCNDDDENDFLINKFIFADRALNDIGDDFLINPIGALQYIQENSNQSFYDFIARLLADNNFDFIPLPTFVDTNDETSYKDIFKPYRFNEAPGCSGPKFVCVYGGERSSQLDIYDGEYENDGADVYSPDLPNDFNDKNVFLVKYGQQNQSIFKDIKLNQEEFSETLESLQVTSDIAGDNKGPNNQNYAGQNIFSIYQNRSYSCEIESMGNPNIQPFMHFQLGSIPMYHGLYLITRVKHNITPNYMKTTFNGTRIRRIATPLIDEYTLYMNLLDQLEVDDSSITSNSGSVNGGNNSEEYSIVNENNNSIIVSNLAADSVGIKLKIPTSDEIEKIILDSKNNSENSGNLFLVPPTQGSILSGFGFRTPPVDGASSNHKGIDISAPVGQNVISPANGVVENINPNSYNGGKMILVNFKNGFVGKFLHLSKIDVSIGDELTVGDKLGEVGATGCCVSGPHLHYELLRGKTHVDPLNYIKTQFT